MTTSWVGVRWLLCILHGSEELAGVWAGYGHCEGVVATRGVARDDCSWMDDQGLACAILGPGDLGDVLLLVARLKKRPASVPPQLHFA